MKIQLPEIKVPQRRLGRNINHDPRSLYFLAPPAKVDKTVSWQRHVPVFDQGNLGSCTGNAEAGLLACDPFFETLPKGTVISEALAVQLYSLATKIDPYGGSYPPTDTGSDGLSVNKAAQQLGFIKGYIHAISVEQAKTLIQQGPFIIGTQWTSNMDRPDSGGFIAQPAGGSVRGGHEYLCFMRDADNDRWWFWNSWGEGWGKHGTFCYDTAGFTALLKQGGDVTQSVSLDKPAPQPQPPEPPPVPPGKDVDLEGWWQHTEPWAAHGKHSTNGKAGIAAHAALELAKKKGLLAS